MVINPNTLRDGLLFADENGPWNTTAITNVLKVKTMTKFGFEITTQKWRQISVAIDKKFMRGIDLDLDDDGDLSNDLMSAHSTHTAVTKYARTAGLISNLSAESIDIFREISDRWQHWYNIN